MPLTDLYFNPSPAPVPWASPALALKRPTRPDLPAEDVAYINLSPPPNPVQAFVQNVRASVAGTGSTPTGDQTVQIQLWAAMFNISLSSKLFLPSMGGNSGVQIPLQLPVPGADNASQAWDLAESDVAAVAAQIGTVVTAAGDVHACLYGNVFGGGIGARRTTLEDPAAGPWDPVNNRRHAQRNTTIRAVPPARLHAFKLWAGNADPDDGHEFVYEVIEQDPRLLTVFEVEQIATVVPWIEAPGLKVSPGRRGFELGAIPNRLLHASTALLGGAAQVLRLPRRNEREQQRGLLGLETRIDGVRLPLLAPKAPLKEFALDIEGGRVDRVQPLALDADEAREVTLTLDVPQEERTIRMFDAVQRDADGRVLDGARITLVSAPDGVR